MSHDAFFKLFKVLKFSDIFKVQFLTSFFESLNKLALHFFHNNFITSFITSYQTRHSTSEDVYVENQHTVQFGLIKVHLIHWGENIFQGIQI